MSVQPGPVTQPADIDAVHAAQRIMAEVTRFVATLTPEQVADLEAGRADIALVPVDQADTTTGERPA